MSGMGRARDETSETTAPTGGAARENRFLDVLIALTAVNVVVFAFRFAGDVTSRDGFLIDPFSPFGGDFINLWTAGKLILSGATEIIYDPARFMEFQKSFVHADIGLRLWAYPPHSLLLAWPFGFFRYLAGFALWSLLGLTFLAWCACRFGLERKETLVLVLSPAALSCVIYGQTGNFFTGLMLLALSPRSRFDPGSVLGAALLTIKPQTGFLLPLVWAFQKRWATIAVTAVVVLSLMAMSLLVFGSKVWSDYLFLTAPELSKLERDGTGPFMEMIPSLFMSLRLAGMSGDHALVIHAVFACLVALVLVWRLSRAADHRTQAALVLVGTCLVTPYMHIYDLSLLLVGGLLMLRAEPALAGNRFYLTTGLVFVAWFAPSLVPVLAQGGVPVTPFLLLVMFLAIREPDRAAPSPTPTRD